MQISESTRAEILLYLPSIGLNEANRIARECECSNDTVYREWRKLRGVEKGKSNMDNPVVLAIAELAITRKKEAKETNKRVNRIMKQLSQA
jgi:transposase-like protein